MFLQVIMYTPKHEFNQTALQLTLGNTINIWEW